MEALDVVRAELLAMDERTLAPIRTDLTAAAIAALGTAATVRRLRPELAALFPEEALRPLDRLDLVARAALEAHADHLAQEEPDMVALGARTLAHRARLLAEARLLIARGAVPSGVIAELSGQRAHKDVAFDVLQLVSVLRTQGGRDRGAHLAALDEAESDVLLLARALGEGALGASRPSARMRLRAFNLLARTYDDVRRLVAFLRWREGDADEIAPPLCGANQGRGKKRAKRGATGGGVPR